MKKIYSIITITIILAIILFFVWPNIPFRNSVQWKIYDSLLKVEYKFKKARPATKDILLVTIDNDTLKNMPDRWPYPRSDFTKVITNLKNAGARLIAFDFVFFGRSQDKEDEALKAAIENYNNIVFACPINDDGLLEPPLLAGRAMPSGIISKLQDSDGVTRKNLSYLVSDKEPDKAFLSWEMQILKEVKQVNLSTIISEGSILSFRNDTGEIWIVPVDPNTKSFLIHFRSHTIDFKRLSFYKIVKGDFDPILVKDKIVLVGLVTSLLGDLHNTPIGWLPGITLNANALSALYNHDFIKSLPRHAELVVLLLGAVLAGLLVSLFKTKMAYALIAIEVIVFFILSYLLLIYGYTWDYTLFPLVVISCPFLSKKLSTPHPGGGGGIKCWTCGGNCG